MSCSSACTCNPCNCAKCECAPTLYYWGIKARGHFAVVLAAYSGNKLNWNRQPEWPGSLKEKSPFGQLPYLEDGSIHIGQSMAIVRYLARKFKLQGDTDADFGLSEMLIEESTDIYNLLAKAQYAPDGKAAAYEKFFKEQLPGHLTNLEKLVHGSQFCSRVLAGDLAIFAILDIIMGLNTTFLASHPKLHAFYNGILAHPGIAALLATGIGGYFSTQ